MGFGMQKGSWLGGSAETLIRKGSDDRSKKVT